jgi:cation transport ATPase
VRTIQVREPDPLSSGHKTVDTAVSAVITIGIDPTIELGPVTLAWHGLMIAIGIVVGGLAVATDARRRGLDTEPIYTFSAIVVVGALVGGRMVLRGGANDAVRALLDLAPPKAIVLRDGEPVEVPTAEVQVGDLLLIRPGSKIPVDAVVDEDESQVDESTVTGESLPVKKGAPGESPALRAARAVALC